MQVLHFFHHDRVVYQLSFLITSHTKFFTFFHHDRVVYQLGRLRPFIHVSFAVSLVGAALSFVLGHKFARDTEVSEQGRVEEMGSMEAEGEEEYWQIVLD